MSVFRMGGGNLMNGFRDLSAGNGLNNSPVIALPWGRHKLLIQYVGFFMPADVGWVGALVQTHQVQH